MKLLLARITVAIVALFGVLAAASPPAQAETETWQIQSHYRYQVELQFYSQDRNAVWPGGGRAFLLDDSKMHSFSLECNPGERICYGAWDVLTGNRTGRKYWGVGQNDRKGCTDCCWTCGRKGAPRAITLTR